MEDLIGRKVKGFKFRSIAVVAYDKYMSKHIGEIGTITKVDEKTCYVEFPDNAWWYPLLRTVENLIEEEPEVEVSLDELINNVKNLISKI